MPKFIDLKGKIFGTTKALEFDKERQDWKCQCIKCGRIKYYPSKKLREGNLSCNCSRKQREYKYEDISGKRFGYLIAISRNKERNEWLCKCDCGNECYASLDQLKKGKRTSCGCKSFKKYKDIKNDYRFKKLYDVYTGMYKRCYKEYCPSYKRYGAKGIKMCDEWLGEEGFNNFFNWAILNGYKIELEGDKNKYAIDRIDSKGNYCPENCRWITQSENSYRASWINCVIDKKIEELNNNSQDELIQKYIERKMQLKEEQYLEKGKTEAGYYFYRKPNYCYLHNTDNSKQYLFRNYTNVGILLGISSSAVGYRVRKKDGVIGEGWKLEKLTKEDYDYLVNKGIEVIR